MGGAVSKPPADCIFIFVALFPLAAFSPNLGGMNEPLQGREVIFEFTPVGNVMRVTAMDVATMMEIAIQCPLHAGESVFRRSALMRLEYVLRKKNLIT